MVGQQVTLTIEILAPNYMTKPPELPDFQIRNAVTRAGSTVNTSEQINGTTYAGVQVEFLIYPHCDSRPLPALTDWLEASGRRSFPAMLLDMYPRGHIEDEPYAEGTDPFTIARWFDPANYTIRKNGEYWNLWIQGGPRGRVFFPDNPEKGPALNKIPLVRWERPYVYVSSTHMLLPRSLNVVYDEDGGEKASGCLLHAKFLSTFIAKSAEELDRRQHYADSQEYRAYHQGLQDAADFWCPQSRRYRDWRQLEEVGLISRGNWA